MSHRAGGDNSLMTPAASSFYRQPAAPYRTRLYRLAGRLNGEALQAEAHGLTELALELRQVAALTRTSATQLAVARRRR